MVRKGIANDPSRNARIRKAALDIVARGGAAGRHLDRLLIVPVWRWDR